MNKPIGNRNDRARSEPARPDNRYKIIFEAINDAIFIVNPATGRFIDVNKPGCHMFGYTKGELVDQDIGFLSSGVCPYTVGEAIKILRKDTTEDPQAIEWLCKARDGTLFWTEVSTRLAEFDNHPAVVAIVRNINTEKLLRTELADSAAALVEAQAVAHSGSWQVDLHDDSAAWSDECCRILGIDPTNQTPSFELFLSRIHPDDRADLIGAYQKSLADHTIGSLDQRIVLDDGTIRTVHQRWQNFYAADGTAQRTTGTVQDVTEARLSEAALKHERDFSAALVASLPGFFVSIDENGHLLRWNENLSVVTGNPDKQLLGSDATAMVVETDREAVQLEVDKAFVTGRADSQFGIRTKTGDVLPTRWSGRTFMRDEHPIFLAIGIDETETLDTERRVRASEAEVLRMARLDALTGLVNRQVFMEAVQQAINRAERGDKAFAVLFVDLDHFKDVNDTLGHPAGDELLRVVAKRLQVTIRDTNRASRFGGDEFAVLADVTDEPVDAAILAERLIATIGAPFSVEGSDIRSGASVGIAIYERDHATPETLLSQADVALYQAKAEGRSRYCFFTPSMEAEVRNRVTLTAELQEAIATGQFFLEYQPQIDAETMRIIGVEALVRWRHPKRGVLSPAEFIPVAEKTGLIVAVDRWVKREACRQAKAWNDACTEPIVMSVNVSGAQFKRALELEKDVAIVLAKSGLSPRLLELELTETVLMEASQDQRDVLVRLRQGGVKLAIDDFGTGYSSLDYLRRFPVDRIKIAQVFVGRITYEPGSAAIVRATISLAKELGLVAIAEGVETEEQFKSLKGWGCPQMQGYYFARPLGSDDFFALLRSQSPTRAQAARSAA